jgi:hypothetical protein
MREQLNRIVKQKKTILICLSCREELKKKREDRFHLAVFAFAFALSQGFVSISGMCALESLGGKKNWPLCKSFGLTKTRA